MTNDEKWRIKDVLMEIATNDKEPSCVRVQAVALFLESFSDRELSFLSKNPED